MSGRYNIKKPDSSVRDKKLETLYAQVKKFDQELDSVRKQIDGNKVSDQTQNATQKLRDQLKEIRKTQSDLKGRRQQIHDKIKQLEEQVRRQNTEVDEKLGKKTRYQSIAEIKQRLEQIDEEMSSGDLSLVEEKVCVKEMQSLNKLIRDMQQVEPIKKSISDDKNTIAELKQELGTLNASEISAQYESIQAELNKMQSKNQVIHDQKSKLFVKKAAIMSKRDEIYSQIKKVKADFGNELKTFRKKVQEERLKREEEQQLSVLMEDKEEKVCKLKEKLIHAKKPAFMNEISCIETALFVLDPTFVKPAANNIDFPGSEPVKPVKKVENQGLVKIVKEKEDYFPPSAKSKKNRKKASNGTASGSSSKFSLEPTLIAILADLEVPVPMSKDDVPATVEQLKKKYDDFLSRQEEQTEKNVAEATAQLEKLELEYAAKENQLRKELEEKREREAAEAETAGEK
ncbi:HCL529Wp [Eremothecium sinecaudum]|uniref:HCL529Wp n=1 Tax=Eremothecium sinecaudum TaxID=45286 RepID=A0A120K1Q4_9SACH|nr:HCL529Wp [Eremothecium sinecaudum]AMD19622.1 HCL529Wp [Eremothecium sinecaudum]